MALADADADADETAASSRLAASGGVSDGKVRGYAYVQAEDRGA